MREPRTENGETHPGGDPLPVVRLAAGVEFAGHRIETEIGRGGMGVVYRARHLALDRDRALKMIAPALSADPIFRERFQRESRLAASVEHPNVIPVHHAGQEQGVLYLSMRLVDGPDLRRIVEAEGRLSPRRAATIVAGVAAGLDAAHTRGLVHRDVKPANVLVEENSTGERVFLTDFGISRISGRGGTLTSSGGVLGSADYVAPEQIEGERSDHRVDVYALGCVLHFALTGQAPFPRDSELAKLYAHANAERPRPSQLVQGLPAEVDPVVARAMSIRPEDRYESAGELAARFERAIQGAEPSAEPTPSAAPAADEAVTGKLRKRPRRRVWQILAGALLLVAAVAVTAALLTNSDHSANPSSPLGGPQIVATTKVEPGPVGLTVSRQKVWVVCRKAGVLEPIGAPSAKAVETPVKVSGSPVAVAAGFGSLWVVDHSEDSVLRVDPAHAGSPTPIRVGANPSDVAVDGRWVWVANKGSNSVSRIDPNTNQVDRTIIVGETPWSVATSRGSAWVANIDGSSISEIDADLGRVVGKPIAVGQRPNALTVGDGYLWVTDVFNGTLTRIDPQRAEVVGDPIEVGNRPRGVTTGFGYVWVANGGDGTVSRIDPRTAAPAGPPVRVGANPADITAGHGAVWTANFDDSTVTKIRP